MANETVPVNEVRKLHRWAQQNLNPEQRGPFEAQLIEHLRQLATTGTTQVDEATYGDDNY